jgi:hypothetical protein
LAAGKAGRFRPLIQTSRADAARVKGIPHMAAFAEPAIKGRGRPTALRAANVRSGWALAGNFVDLSNRRIYNGGHFIIMYKSFIEILELRSLQ